MSNPLVFFRKQTDFPVAYRRCTAASGFGLLVRVLVLLFLVGQPVFAADQKGAQRYVTIDFNDVDINVFIKYISDLTKKNFIVDRSVKGKVTIISPTRISVDDASRVFESVLEVHGYTTVPAGAVIKIIPAVQARAKSIATIRQGEIKDPEDKVVTQIISLKHTSANEIKRIITPLISKTSVLIAHDQSGILILTDFQSNIARLMEIINEMDVPSIGEEMVIIPLKHASAQAVSKSVGQLFVQRRVKGKAIPSTIKVIPYERTNALIVFADRGEVEKIRGLIAQLDIEVPRGEGNIQVYYLQHASAEELVKVLTSLPAQQPTGGAKGAPPVKAPAISKDMKITADVETNSLIITAPREEYLVLEDVIKKLDIPRRMVYMEALIMEVQVTKDFQIGVQWGGSGHFADETGKLAGGFSGSAGNPYDILRGIGTDPAVLPAGFTLGVLQSGIEIGGIRFPDLGSVLNAYQDDSDINVISAPQILTTDNKEAQIKVGENVPYITSQNTTSAEQDYTNYEYKDVATTLKITPQINHADVVRMDIDVEVVRLQSAGTLTPSTFTRTAKTTVIMRNEETVVIGGIIGQDTDGGEYKVPLLGDIPLLGWLFKTKGEREAKTNLFIFITPHIVENPAELAELYYSKRDAMEEVQPRPSKIVNEFFYNETKPSYAVSLADVGFAKLRQGDLETASQYFRQALKIDPDNPYALINMGVIHERQGQAEEARQMYQQVLDQDFDTIIEGQKEEAIEALRDMARENLKHLENH